MNNRGFIVTALETKAIGNADEGTFEGYGAVFGNIDWHGDVIEAGAFSASIAEHKAAGTRPLMHFNHGLPALGGVRGVGTWDDLAEDGKGLRVKGRVAGMNTDAGRYRYEQVKSGAVPGMSIGYVVAPGGAVTGKTTGAKRTLIRLGLKEISIVDDPSNGSALIDGIKAAFGLGGPADTGEDDEDADTAAAALSLAEAMRLHNRTMTDGGYDYSSSRTKNLALLMGHLRDAYFAITGDRAPADLPEWKTNAVDDLVSDLVKEFKISPDKARTIIAARLVGETKTAGNHSPAKTGFAALAKLDI